MGNRMRSNLRPSPVSPLQALLDSVLSTKQRSSCTGGVGVHTGKERWLFADYIPRYSSMEYFVGDNSSHSWWGHRGELLAVCRNGKAAILAGSETARFHRKLNMLNRDCQNRGKQLCQNVHDESPFQHKTKDVPNWRLWKEVWKLRLPSLAICSYWAALYFQAEATSPISNALVHPLDSTQDITPVLNQQGLPNNPGCNPTGWFYPKKYSGAQMLALWQDICLPTHMKTVQCPWLSSVLSPTQKQLSTF